MSGAEVRRLRVRTGVLQLGIFLTPLFLLHPACRLLAKGLGFNFQMIVAVPPNWSLLPHLPHVV